MTDDEKDRETQIDEIVDKIELQESDDLDTPEEVIEESDDEATPESEESDDAVDEFQEPEAEEPGPEDLKEEPETGYPDFLNLKVDGKTQKVSSAAVFDAGIRAMQKESAADVRLEEAANLKREAEESLQNAREKGESIAPTPEQAKTMRSVITNFELNFPDLSADDNLRTLVILETDRLRAEGYENDWTTYEKAAKKVQTWHGRIASERVTKQQFQTKLDRKRQASGTTVAGVNAKTETSKKKEAPEPTTSDVIAEMRKARHQE